MDINNYPKTKNGEPDILLEGEETADISNGKRPSQPQVLTNPAVLRKQMYGNSGSGCEKANIQQMELYLEKEKLQNKADNWNKLDKTSKIQKLHGFAEKYGKEHKFPVKEIKQLKVFFNESLEKNKLQKAKDIVYDKEMREIVSIPALYFNSNTHNFSLKIMDAKRVSTLKSLTPKRTTKPQVVLPITDTNSQMVTEITGDLSSGV